MRTARLFKDEILPMQPAADRREPVIWVRRLVIVEELSPQGAVIREVEFRRGLNIIRTEKRQPDETRTVGHSVGKTLLLRLVRYCLGEKAYCTEAIRSAVAEKLPHAYVLAEVRVGGQPWAVARPLGMDGAGSASFAAQADDLDVLRGDRKALAKFSEFVAAVEAATTTCFEDMKLPNAKRLARWLDLLAWLARDQECRYRHHNEWRDPDSESGTRDLQKEDTDLVVRMVLDLLDREERALKTKHAALLAEKAEIEVKMHGLLSHLEYAERGLRAALGLSEDIPHGDFLSQKAQEVAGKKQQDLDRLRQDLAGDPKIGELHQASLNATAALAVAEDGLKRLGAEKEEKSRELEQVQQASDDDFYASLEPQGGWCRLFTTREAAVAAGCPGAPPAHKPGERDPNREARVEQLSHTLSALDDQIRAEHGELSRLDREAAEAKGAYAKALKQREGHIDKIGQDIGRWTALTEQAAQYAEGLQERARLEKAVASKQKDADASLEAQKQARLKHEKKRRQLSEHFASAVQAMLGSEAGGSVEIDANRVYPKTTEDVAASGAALGTSTVLGFDIACLMASVTGLGYHPRLLLHDSPREADLEEAIYHRLFHLVASLEAAFKGREPSFQYIVTTTTPPPPELDSGPYVRLRLDAREDAGCLLGIHF